MKEWGKITTFVVDKPVYSYGSRTKARRVYAIGSGYIMICNSCKVRNTHKELSMAASDARFHKCQGKPKQHTLSSGNTNANTVGL